MGLYYLPLSKTNLVRTSDALANAPRFQATSPPILVGLVLLGEVAVLQLFNVLAMSKVLRRHEKAGSFVVVTLYNDEALLGQVCRTGWFTVDLELISSDGEEVMGYITLPITEVAQVMLDPNVNRMRGRLELAYGADFAHLEDLDDGEFDFEDEEDFDDYDEDEEDEDPETRV